MVLKLLYLLSLLTKLEGWSHGDIIFSYILKWSKRKRSAKRTYINVVIVEVYIKKQGVLMKSHFKGKCEEDDTDHMIEFLFPVEKLCCLWCCRTLHLHRMCCFTKTHIVIESSAPLLLWHCLFHSVRLFTVWKTYDLYSVSYWQLLEMFHR